ncbi:hypothetical protein [uncultured Microbacterium sp.]|uniref:hypothetical protein n=1 Tax=uncultured Microbacterium sp. TaxID=191216 RepID=UPI0025DC458F|nr:hypothetical protein [uncultured Microbacterium sp.]
MSIPEHPRPGHTFTHAGVEAIIVKIIGSTVIVRDSNGHTHCLWADAVMSAGDALPPIDSESSAPPAPTPAKPSSVDAGPVGIELQSDKVRVEAHFRDVDEYIKAAAGRGPTDLHELGMPAVLAHPFRFLPSDCPDAA